MVTRVLRQCWALLGKFMVEAGGIEPPNTRINTGLAGHAAKKLQISFYSIIPSENKMFMQ